MAQLLYGGAAPTTATSTTDQKGYVQKGYVMMDGTVSPFLHRNADPDTQDVQPTWRSTWCPQAMRFDCFMFDRLSRNSGTKSVSEQNVVRSHET